MEREKAKRDLEEARREDELDYVPTKERGSAKKGKVPKKYQVQDHPIFFKGSRIESSLPQGAKASQGKP